MCELNAIQHGTISIVFDTETNELRRIECNTALCPINPDDDILVSKDLNTKRICVYVGNDNRKPIPIIFTAWTRYKTEEDADKFLEECRSKSIKTAIKDKDGQVTVIS